MISRYPSNATPCGSDEGTGLHPAFSDDARGAYREGAYCSPARDYTVGHCQNQVQGLSLRTVCLWAAFVFVPVVLVASWFQYRVVGGLESELTATEARGIASKMNAVIDARASALRMAAGSIEIENLAASGGLNRLLGGLKDLFPDFRSLEILNEQGQPLAMMGELSLEHVGKRSGMLKSSNQDTGLNAEPLFRDVPANDCFFLTMRHQGTDGAVWFSRARFSREALTSVLEPQRADRNVALVSARTQSADFAKPVSCPKAVASSTEPSPSSSFGLRTRSFTARVPLGTADWMVTLERTVPVSSVLYLSLVLGGVFVACAGIFLFLSRKSSNAPGTIHAMAVPEITDPLQAQDRGDSPFPDAADREPDVSETFSQALAQEAMVDVQDATEGAIMARPRRESDEFGPASTEPHSVIEKDTFSVADETTLDEAGCDPFAGLEEELGLNEDLAADSGAVVSEQHAEDIPARAEIVLAVPDETMEDESVVLMNETAEESIIVGEPLMDDPIPDTLEVCWTESPEEATKPAEQSGAPVVKRWWHWGT